MKRYYSRSLINGKPLQGEQYTKLGEDCIIIKCCIPSRTKKGYINYDDIFQLTSSKDNWMNYDIEYSLEIAPENTRAAMIRDFEVMCHNLADRKLTPDHYILTLELLSYDDNETR